MNNTIPPHHIKRLRAEARFRWYGRAALGFALLCLAGLLGNIFYNGAPGFLRTEITLEVPFDRDSLELLPGESVRDASPMRFNSWVRASLMQRFPDVAEEDKRSLFKIVASGAGRTLRDMAVADESLLGGVHEVRLPASRIADVFLENPADNGIRTVQRMALDVLAKKGHIRRGLSAHFFTEGDSRQPENAGFSGAMAGSFFTIFVCLLAAFPLGVMSAIYLQEFAKNTHFSHFIEVNVSNLAAVPSIVYGLLGLAVYINVMHLPRSAPLVGGLTLALMVFPIIIIATRSALASVPPSIRQAALALGASPLQTVWHHTLPLAMPGIMTGTILGMARAMGETAPLLMIGMVAFVADIPTGFTQAATTMPVQVYLWASSPDAAFAEKTAAGILVLLALLLCMNAAAIVIRKKFEVRW